MFDKVFHDVVFIRDLTNESDFLISYFYANTPGIGEWRIVRLVTDDYIETKRIWLKTCELYHNSDPLPFRPVVFIFRGILRH